MLGTALGFLPFGTFSQGLFPCICIEAFDHVVRMRLLLAANYWAAASPPSVFARHLRAFAIAILAAPRQRQCMRQHRKLLELCQTIRLQNLDCPSGSAASTRR